MKKMKLGKSFAFAAGKESTDSVAIKRYIGIAPVFILDVNPTKEELGKLYGRDIEKDPEYITEVEVGPEGNKHNTTRVRLDFIIKTDAEKCNGVDITTKMAFFITKEYQFNKDQTKVKVIDKYGRTAWVTKEECQNHSIPVYKNGPAQLDADYRPCYIGEEDVTNFIKNYLGIPNAMEYVNNVWKMRDNLEDCESRLDHIDDYFKGNFTELKQAIALQPNNKVKVLFGVRKTDDGKEYQTFYNQMTFKNNASNYKKLEEEIADRKAKGAFANTEFEICELKEYTVEATQFTETGFSEIPTQGEAQNNPWGI